MREYAELLKLWKEEDQRAARQRENNARRAEENRKLAKELAHKWHNLEQKRIRLRSLYDCALALNNSLLNAIRSLPESGPGEETYKDFLYAVHQICAEKLNEINEVSLYFDSNRKEIDCGCDHIFSIWLLFAHGQICKVDFQSGVQENISALTEAIKLAGMYDICMEYLKHPAVLPQLLAEVEEQLRNNRITNRLSSDEKRMVARARTLLRPQLSTVIMFEAILPHSELKLTPEKKADVIVGHLAPAIENFKKEVTEQKAGVTHRVLDDSAKQTPGIQPARR